MVLVGEAGIYANAAVYVGEAVVYIFAMVFVLAHLVYTTTFGNVKVNSAPPAGIFLTARLPP